MERGDPSEGLTSPQRRFLVVMAAGIALFSALRFQGPAEGYWDTYITVPAMFMTGHEVDLSMDLLDLDAWEGLVDALDLIGEGAFASLHGIPHQAGGVAPELAGAQDAGVAEPGQGQQGHQQARVDPDAAAHETPFLDLRRVRTRTRPNTARPSGTRKVVP